MPTLPEFFEQAARHHQSGQLGPAEALCRQILQTDPRHANAWHLLGVIAGQVGRYELAVEYIGHALRLMPDFAPAHYNLGIFLAAQGKLEEAAACYRRSIRLNPHFADVHNNLGLVLRQMGKLQEAEICYRQSIQLKPDFSKAFHNLAVVLRDQHKLNESETCYREAIRLDPGYAEAHNNLGVVLQEQGRPKESEACYREAFRLKPDYAEACSNLATVLCDLGSPEDPETYFRRALLLRPDKPEVHNNLGVILQQRGRLEESEACYHAALRLKPEYAEALNNLGNVLCEQGKLHEAEPYCHQVLRLKPSYAEAHNTLGFVLLELGRLEEAEQCFRAALGHDPRLTDAWFQLTTLLRGRLSDADLTAMRRLRGDADLAPGKRSALCFGLAQVLDARQEFDEAGANLAEGNALALVQWRQRGQVYDPAAHTQLIDRLMAEFSPSFFERVRDSGVDSERPIFIVGLPRSGTTLTEQILASHSQVFAAGELNLTRENFRRLAGNFTDDGHALENLAALDRATIRSMADWHLDRLRAIHEGGRHITDKMPDNYLYMGFLAALFPRAKFIHCRRDLRDVALSCWMTNFRSLLWTGTVEHIAARFHDYERLMKHWRQVLPVPVLEVDYEEVVADLEGVARRLISWCGLEWEAACLKFHESARPVHTASAIQVREPIFNRSVGRWRHYEKSLAALFTRLPMAEHMGQAVCLKPADAEALINLGNVLCEQGKWQEAERCLREAVRLKADLFEARFNLGNVFRNRGNLEDAEGCYREVLRLKPGFADAHNNLGVVLHEQGRLEEAEACYLEALRLKPSYTEAHNNLGDVRRDRGKLDAAEASCREALRLKPSYAEAHYNLGNVLRDQGNLQEADVCYRQALRLEPGYAEAHNNLGNILRDQGKWLEAEANYRQALDRNPRFADARNNLGVVLQEQGRLEEAIVCCRDALRLKPDYAQAHNNLGNMYKDQGRLEEAMAAFRQALRCQPDFVVAHSNLLYTLIFSPNYDAQAILEEHRRWSQRYAEPLARHIEPHANDRSAQRRLRIGYVSPDFCHHAESFFTVPLLSAHDHRNFEIFCYGDVVRPDEITARLRSYADVWRDINGLTDEQVADLVRRDKIDILVDLTMHMARNRLLAFARKPAPVQVSWLAYQGTTGLRTIDYRLTDPIIDPPGLFDQCYSEESIRLPDAFWCYDPLGNGSSVSTLPVLRKGHVTFGCLNNFCKVNGSVLRLWAKVLRAVPDSSLLLLAAEGAHRQNTLDVLEHEAVQPERVSFVARLPRPRYMELYHDIDMGLDTFPYTGQTTSLDAFWQGVPVVTLVGQTAVARAGRSLLENLGLPELVADTPEQFVNIATALANDWPRLRDLRANLRDRLRQSTLMDAPRFARSVEAAYRTMWQRWCQNP